MENTHYQETPKSPAFFKFSWSKMQEVVDTSNISNGSIILHPGWTLAEEHAAVPEPADREEDEASVELPRLQPRPLHDGLDFVPALLAELALLLAVDELVVVVPGHPEQRLHA